MSRILCDKESRKEKGGGEKVRVTAGKCWPRRNSEKVEGTNNV